MSATIGRDGSVSGNLVSPDESTRKGPNFRYLLRPLGEGPQGAAGWVGAGDKIPQSWARLADERRRQLSVRRNRWRGGTQALTDVAVRAWDQHSTAARTGFAQLVRSERSAPRLARTDASPAASRWPTSIQRRT